MIRHFLTTSGKWHDYHVENYSQSVLIKNDSKFQIGVKQMVQSCLDSETCSSDYRASTGAYFYIHSSISMVAFLSCLMYETISKIFSLEHKFVRRFQLYPH